ncbi:UDP-2,4-diacetamido-2,4,6-trideoxy-beta-L-altropyranose hydrolase [Lysinibacillus telephonicus]|uniref:UDP-2,4-diacetamido-2,4, 6-trideoxy-beta-L-altropyranose hydrolase n=1 Tax=Lysinibacillus telephonicus TaxID=1714840 RepID=A0A3S0JQY5_9BACI|nr:UDP-2,4-diacetamido-2,4,6-trideoxy-beta-L-altropyranose hydrolase [Lysinibacillus telephonicus]RTQ94283.1 UDP-2,4-diacetamido-2,4,6-trideoxy-beta-L-altropyranose hydrolase [Lysinibacillus telephonicus]
MKKIIIRTDASTQIGSGHVMRCLTIAKNLKKQGYQVIFWMEPLQGNLISYVKAQGFEHILGAENADLYIVDHYDIDQEWERIHRKYTKKIMVIDDLANRNHDCDLLLDQNVVPEFKKRYETLIPQYCKTLLGPKYLILRDEFLEARQLIDRRNGNVEHILIFMGGTDPTHETMKVLNALPEISHNFKHIDVVVGKGNLQKNKIERICKERGYHYHCQINYIASLIQQADFSIGAGGSTTWERCYLGLPSSSTIVAENQYEATKYAAELGAVLNLGWHNQVTIETYKDLLNTLNAKQQQLSKISEMGLSLTNNEVPNPWIDEIMELLS